MVPKQCTALRCGTRFSPIVMKWHLYPLLVALTLFPSVLISLIKGQSPAFWFAPSLLMISFQPLCILLILPFFNRGYFLNSISTRKWIQILIRQQNFTIGKIGPVTLEKRNRWSRYRFDWRSAKWRLWSTVRSSSRETKYQYKYKCNPHYSRFICEGKENSVTNEYMYIRKYSCCFWRVSVIEDAVRPLFWRTATVDLSKILFSKNKIKFRFREGEVWEILGKYSLN